MIDCPTRAFEGGRPVDDSGKFVPYPCREGCGGPSCFWVQELELSRHILRASIRARLQAEYTAKKRSAT